MKIFTLHDKCDTPVCLALGFFDCVHIGHTTLLDAVKIQAEKCGAAACAVTFPNNPYPILKKGEKVVFTFEERLKLFENSGIRAVISIPFNNEFMQTSKDEFLNSLIDSFDVKGIVCGYDYKFGAGADGNAGHIAEYCAKNGIMCDVIPPVLHNGTRISSTSVKKLLRSGDVDKARELLGHGYFIEGEVCHGRGVGRLFDFPTANINRDPDKLLPQNGVYATYTIAGGVKYKSVTNIGDKPTFGENSVTVETLLNDFSGDLYGKTLKIEFVRRLRDIKKFSSPAELKAQITQDSQWR